MIHCLVVDDEGNKIILKGVDADIQLGDTYRMGFYSVMKQKLVE